MLSDSDLARLEALAAKATPGTWTVKSYGTSISGAEACGVSRDFARLPDGTILHVKLEYCGRDDAEFIAASRDAIPALVAEVRRLSAKADRLTEALRGCVEALDTGRWCTVELQCTPAPRAREVLGEKGSES